jgi:hypothetical protein
MGAGWILVLVDEKASFLDVVLSLVRVCVVPRKRGCGSLKME